MTKKQWPCTFCRRRDGSHCTFESLLCGTVPLVLSVYTLMVLASSHCCSLYMHYALPLCPVSQSNKRTLPLLLGKSVTKSVCFNGN